MHLRSKKIVASSSKPCQNPIHKRKPKEKVTEMAVSKEDFEALNDRLINSFETSIQKLEDTLSEQNKQTHVDLNAVNATMKDSIEKPDSFTKGSTSLGRIPTFSGKESEALEFIEQFKCFADFGAWNDQQRLAAFPLALTDSARTWFFTNDHKYTTFTELCKLFRERFLSKSDEWLLRQELTNRKQSENESVLDYCGDILKRCQRLNISKTEQLHNLIQGFLPRIRDHVILSQPKTIDEAITIAKIKASLTSKHANAITSKDLQSLEANMINAIQKVSTNAALPKIAAFDQETRPEQIPELGNFIKSQVQNEIRRLDLVPRPQNPFRSGDQRFQFNTRGDFGKNSSRTTTGQILCYRCQKVGHFSRNCPEQRFPGTQGFQSRGRGFSPRPVLNSMGGQRGSSFAPHRQ